MCRSKRDEEEITTYYFRSGDKNRLMIEGFGKKESFRWQTHVPNDNFISEAVLTFLGKHVDPDLEILDSRSITGSGKWCSMLQKRISCPCEGCPPNLSFHVLK